MDGPVYLSRFSAWEIEIKHGLMKLELPEPLERLFDLAGRGIEFLEPTTADLLAYAQLDFPDKSHRDPFDRMLVVQTKLQDLQLVTADQVFAAYLPAN